MVGLLDFSSHIEKLQWYRYHHTIRYLPFLDASTHHTLQRPSSNALAGLSLQGSVDFSQQRSARCQSWSKVVIECIIWYDPVLYDTSMICLLLLFFNPTFFTTWGYRKPCEEAEKLRSQLVQDCSHQQLCALWRCRWKGWKILPRSNTINFQSIKSKTHCQVNLTKLHITQKVGLMICRDKSLKPKVCSFRIQRLRSAMWRFDWALNQCI